MVRLPFILYCLIGLHLSAICQVNYGIRQYSTENGLPSNGIKGLQWDEATGFLWIATEAGLVRFNGVDFNSFNVENSKMASDRMLFLVRDYFGRIYTADQGGNIFTIDKSKVKFVENSGTNGLRYENLFLYSTSPSILKRYRNIKPKQDFILPFDHLLTVSDTSFYVLRNGAIYYHSLSQFRQIVIKGNSRKIVSLVSIDGEVFLFDEANNFYLFKQGEELARTEVLDEEGKKLNDGSQQFLFGVNGMTQPIVFIGARAWQLKKEKNMLRATLIATNVPTDAFVSFVQYSQKRNLLFIGTDSKGLIVINRNRVRQIKRQFPGINDRNAYYGQVELPGGNIFTNAAHIIGDNPIPSNVALTSPFIFSFFTTPDSLGWYTQSDRATGKTQLYNYNFRNNTTTSFPKINILGSMAVTMSGRDIYIAQQDGISIIKDSAEVKLHSFGGTDRIIYDMQEMEKGELMIASCMGLLKYSIATNRMDTIFRNNDYCVRALWKYKDYLFFGTYGKGFYILKDGVVKAMPLDKNKYLSYAHCFIPDGLGYCYISTNRGLFKASIDEMISAWTEDKKTVYYHYFGKKDGMENTEMNGGCKPCAIQLKNGMLSFPTMDGLLWVDPVKADMVFPEGEIYLDEYTVDGVKMNVDTAHPLSLPPGTKEIVFKIGFSAWCNQENIYIDYQLNDTLSWKRLNIENGSFLSFNSLPPGHYNLRFRKLNGFGNNYSYKNISFDISYPWYLSWWFFIISGVVVFGLLVMIFNFRTRQYQKAQKKLEAQVTDKTRELQQKNAELEKAGSIKTRLISIISHDIVTPLKFVTVAAKNLSEKGDQMPPDLQKETISEISNTSQELQLLSTNILNWIKYQNENRRLVKENFNLHAAVDNVLGVLTSLARQKGLVLINNVDENLEVYQYFEPVKILVYNLLTNSINFSEKGKIEIRGYRHNDNIRITVRDEGSGMTRDQVTNILTDQFIISSANVDNKKGNGLGYLIIKDLLKTMNASLKIESEKNHGTKVTIEWTTGKHQTN